MKHEVFVNGRLVAVLENTESDAAAHDHALRQLHRMCEDSEGNNLDVSTRLLGTEVATTKVHRNNGESIRDAANRHRQQGLKAR